MIARCCLAANRARWTLGSRNRGAKFRDREKIAWPMAITEHGHLACFCHGGRDARAPWFAGEAPAVRDLPRLFWPGYLDAEYGELFDDAANR